jgi:hypothetical protein
MPPEPQADETEAPVPCAESSFNRFEDALEGAELLLDFSARNGIKTDKFGEKEFATAALSIAQTKEKYESKILTAIDRSNFYEVYWQLAQLLQPVSVNSIRDSYSSFGQKRRRYIFAGPMECISCADLAVRWWRWKAVIVLLALLLAQIYWVIGSAFIEGIRTPDQQTKSTNATATPITPSPPDFQQLTKDKVRRDTLYDLLEKWWYYSLLPPSVKALPNKRSADATEQELKHAASLLECCAQTVSVLQVYFLPLLYGLLGAHAYVLRELIRENRERVYRRESETAYRMRVILGLLAGLAIGWFAKPDPASSGIIAKLGPFALSFLAGYSVEVLFSVMDRFVSAFGSLSQQSKS